MVHPIITRDLAIVAVEPLAQPIPSSPLLSEPQQPFLPSSNPNIRSKPLPGVRCPNCASRGKESWVIPGRACSLCGTPCF